MPLKNGKLTPKERAFSRVLADTQNVSYAAHKAGLKGKFAGSEVLARPAVKAEVARIQQERLFSEALPLAVNTVVSILKSETSPAGARVQAAKLVFDRTLGTDEAGKQKEPHELTAEELQAKIDELKHLAAERARVVLEARAEPDETEGAENDGIFG